MDKFVEAFGVEMLTTMGVSVAAFLLVSTGLIWWPALRAWRKSAPLPHPRLFVTVVSSISYSAVNIPAIVLGMPLGFLITFLLPQLEQGDLAQWPWLVALWKAIEDWGWLVFPFITLLLTWWLTRRLAQSLADICHALAPNNSSKPMPLRGSA